MIVHKFATLAIHDLFFKLSVDYYHYYLYLCVVFQFEYDLKIIVIVASVASDAGVSRQFGTVTKFRATQFGSSAGEEQCFTCECKTN